MLELENAKKEILWYLICNGKIIRDKFPEISISPLSFDGPGINGYISEMIKEKLYETDIYSYISYEYDEIWKQDKQKAKSRLEFLDYLFSYEVFDDHFQNNDLEE